MLEWLEGMPQASKTQGDWCRAVRRTVKTSIMGIPSRKPAILIKRASGGRACFGVSTRA